MKKSRGAINRAPTFFTNNLWYRFWFKPFCILIILYKAHTRTKFKTMKAKHIILSTFLYGALSLSMLTIETPETDFANSSATELFTNGSSGQFYAQAAPGGERRRVRRRTRRRTKRRVERRQNATGFAVNFTKTYIA
jgi:hypothetical protein